MDSNSNERLLKLEQEFKDYKEVTTKDTLNLKKEIENHEQRLKEIETSKQRTDFQYEQIMETLQKINDKTIPNLIKEIEELKNKPVKRYDQVITITLSTLLGGIIGFIINIIFGGGIK